MSLKCAENGGNPMCEGDGMAPRSSGRAGLVGLLTALGAAATVEGVRGVVQGADQVVGGGPVSANVDSEYRFYSAWFAVFGVLLLGAARRPERETRLVRAAAGGCLLGASGRVLSTRTAGPPHPMQRALMAIEFALAAVLVLWQARVAGDRQPRMERVPRSKSRVRSPSGVRTS
jgi:hypothetical protein